MVIAYANVFQSPFEFFRDRYEEQFVVANFDSAPTADSEFFGKLDSSIRDEHESRVSLCSGNQS